MTVRKRVATVFTISIALISSPALSKDLCRSVGKEWVWFGDHLAMTVDYHIVGRGDRTFEVGTGISVNKSVWGSTQKSKRYLAVTAYGAGAIHVRKADDGPDFEVCVGASKMNVIQLCGKNWLGYNDCPTF